MKKTTLGLLTVLLGWYSVSARQITPDEALSVASEFMSSSELNSANATNSVLRPMKAPGVAADAGVSPYYIFNRGENEGFVIISGDDRAPKILGYSDKGSFDADNLPPQLKDLMERWTKQIEGMFGVDMHPSWSGNVSTRAEDGVLLETANWGQGFPYNAECPIVEGANCMTGCVATAMAIVMKYHNWPETYNWSSMPMNTEKDPLDYEVVNPALSGLMADAGEAVYMNYSPWDSGADMNWVGHKMQYAFHYSPECQFISSEYHPADKWTNMIQENIDNGNPIIYCGSGTGSHAFVIDGYSSLGYHINWGWDGQYNGYFTLDDLTPNEYQTFSDYTGMVLNITPDKSGDVYSECFVDNGYFFGGRGGLLPPMNISVEKVEKNKVFHVANQVATFPNEFTGEYGIALVSENKEIKEVLKSVYIQENGDPDLPFRGYQIHFTNLKVTKDIEPTDHLQLVTKKDGEDTYKLMLGTLEYSSSIGIDNNTPQWVNVNITVGPGVYFEYRITENQRIRVPEGVRKLENVLKGLDFEFGCGPLKVEEDKIVILTLKGEYVYGDIQNFRIDEGTYATYTTLSSDYDVNAQLYELTSESVTLEEAGTLKEKLSGKEKNSINKLKVSGKINAKDIWYMRDYCPTLEHLDLKDSEIESVYAEDEKMTQFGRNPNNEANALPEFALSSLRFLKEIDFPESLTKLCDYSLCDVNLEKISLPKGVDEIGLNVMSGCPNLKEVELLNPEPVYINDCVFAYTECPYNGTLYVPTGTADKYRQMPVWQDFKEIIEGRMPTKVEMSLSDSDRIDIYGVNGMLIKQGCDSSSLNALTPGIYLIRQGSEMKKLVIR